MAVEIVCSAPNYQIIRKALMLHGPMTHQQIAARTGLTVGAVKRAVKRMAGTGEVEVEPLVIAMEGGYVRVNGKLSFVRKLM